MMDWTKAPAIAALKRAHDEQLIAQWLATHHVERVPMVIEDLDVRSVVKERIGFTAVGQKRA
jgi:hypothetical protein